MTSAMKRPQKQTRRASAVETLTNIAVGYGIQTYALFLLAPAFGFHISLGDSALFGILMTGLSMARQFLLRRFFEALRHYGMLP